MYTYDHFVGTLEQYAVITSETGVPPIPPAAMDDYYDRMYWESFCRFDWTHKIEAFHVAVAEFTGCFRKMLANDPMHDMSRETRYMAALDCARRIAGLIPVMWRVDRLLADGTIQESDLACGNERVTELSARVDRFSGLVEDLPRHRIMHPDEEAELREALDRGRDDLVHGGPGPARET